MSQHITWLSLKDEIRMILSGEDVKLQGGVSTCGAISRKRCDIEQVTISKFILVIVNH